MTDSERKFNPRQHAEAMANTLGLTIRPEWTGTVDANLVMLEAAAQLVLQHEIPDDSESALIFSARPAGDL